MKIHELPSQDMEVPTNDALKRAEELVREIEEASPMSLSGENVKKLRNVVVESFAHAEFSEEQRVCAWRLSYRLWNTSVDIVNNLEADQELTEDHAELRQIASDILIIAGAIGNARSSFVRIAMFSYKTGCAWHKIKKYLKASACFERAFELCFKQEGSSQSSDNREQVEFFFDLFLARARTAWELGGQTLACSLLGRARGLLPNAPTDRRAELAEQYLQFGKSLLLKDDADSKTESVRYMETGLDVCSEALSISQLHEDDRTNLERLKQQLLRNLAAGHLQNENYESALRCVDALRLTTDQTGTSYFALRALAKLGRYDEAEQELFTLVNHAGERVDVYISALEIVIQECSRIDAAEKAFFILLEHVGPSRAQLPAKILEKLLRQEPSGDPIFIKRVETALKIACDEKILTSLVTENEGGLMLEHRRQQCAPNQRQSIHALLWTSGSEHFQAKMYKTSIRLFEASMLYIVHDSEGCMLEAKSLRVLCLCHMALSQFDRAAEVLDRAEKIDPSIATIFLKFKIGLQARDETEACKQIERMLDCPDFEPEFLNLACHEAIACKTITVAIASLSTMLSLYSSDRAMTTGEVVVLRNLILLLIKERNKRSDILRYFMYAQKRLQDIGCEKFFGAGSNGEREIKWYSGAAWNEAMECGSEQDWKTCAEFFAISSNFYSVLPKSFGSLQFVQTALLLCVSALLAAVDMNESEVIHIASNYLEKCQKVHEALVAMPDSGNITDESYDIYLNLLQFELKGRATDDKEQLKILKRCSAMPGFTAAQFFKMGLETCNRKQPAAEVAAAAFRMCLTLTLSDPNADYKVVAAVIRKMINLASTRCKDGPEVLELYKQAQQILSGLGNNVYPQDEAQWLVSTAWNRAALYLKLQKYDNGELWMGVALELLKHVPAMETHRASMMESLTELLRQKASARNAV